MGSRFNACFSRSRRMHPKPTPFSIKEERVSSSTFGRRRKTPEISVHFWPREGPRPGPDAIFGRSGSGTSRGCSFRPKWEQNHSRESIQSRFRSRVGAESRRCGNNVHPATSAFRRLSPAIPAANHQPANSNAFVRHWVAESAPPPTETRETLRACGCGGQFVDVQLSGGFH